MIGAALAGALLAAAVVRVGVADIAAAAGLPRPALSVSPHDARALAEIATTVQLGGQQQLAIRLARRTLAREPMNVAALRTLGVAREQLGDHPGAARAMYLAAPLGWRDAAVQVWLINAYAQQGFVRDALQRADALARLDQLPNVTFPIFTTALKDDRMRAALIAEMADRPFWREIFFFKVMDLPADQMPNVLRLVAGLAAAGSPVTADERNVVLSRLVALGQGPAALAFWRQDRRVAADAPLLWDGGFAHVPARGALGSPFAWQLTPEGAGVASIVGTDRGHQLAVAAGHDFNGTLAATTVVLRPGSYRIAARTSGAAPAGLGWAVRCQPGQEQLPVDAGQTADLTGTFAIPADGHCPTVALALTAASGDDLGGGQTLIDDVTIRRIG